MIISTISTITMFFFFLFFLLSSLFFPNCLFHDFLLGRFKFIQRFNNTGVDKHGDVEMDLGIQHTVIYSKTIVDQSGKIRIVCKESTFLGDVKRYEQIEKKITLQKLYWLVVWNICFPYILGIIIPTD